MPDISEMVSIADYAKAIGLAPISVQQKARRGNIPGAVKIGNTWLIPRDAPYPDARIKSGKYRNWRKKKVTGDEDPL